MQGGGLCFPKSLRLNKRSSYLYMNRKARRYFTEHLVVLWLGNKLERGRIGITITRRIAGAVGRNRFKRRVKEAYRTLPLNLRNGLDLVVSARKGAHLLDGGSLKAELNKALSAIHTKTNE